MISRYHIVQYFPRTSYPTSSNSLWKWTQFLHELENHILWTSSWLCVPIRSMYLKNDLMHLLWVSYTEFYPLSIWNSRKKLWMFWNPKSGFSSHSAASMYIGMEDITCHHPIMQLVHHHKFCNSLNFSLNFTKFLHELENQHSKTRSRFYF